MKEKLIRELKRVGVVERGVFKLKSGVVSDYYIDMKKAFGYPEVMRLLVDLVSELVSEEANCVACQGHGGMPLATAISLKLGLKLVLVREKAKDHGRNTLIDGYVPNERDRIWIIDDVFSNGTSVRNTEAVLKQTGANIIGCSVILKRGDGAIDFPLNYILEAKDIL